MLEHGRPKVGFLGVSGQAVALPEKQRGDTGRDRGLLVLAVTPGGPADAAGLLIGNVIVEFDRQPIRSTDDLLALLTVDRVGRAVPVRVLRGGEVRELTVTVAERPAS